MERAGACAARIALEMLEGKALILAGPGNNGGDAFVVARLLKQAGHLPVVLFAGDPARLPEDARGAHGAWLAGGGRCLAQFPEDRFGLIVDGLFGIGLARPIDGLYAEWIERANASGAPILALDTPSGLNALTGQVTGPVIRATRTVAFIALKPGLLTGEGPDLCGRIDVCDLDLDVGAGDGQVVSPELFRAYLKPRLRNSHKGSFGSVAILGGAPGMAGAALLAGRAALKLGAGRVYPGMLETLAVDVMQPELMLRSPDDALRLASVLAIGPGLGQSPSAEALLAQVFDCDLPLIIDADGLNLLAKIPQLQRKCAVSPAPTLLTPHPAEAARLLGCLPGAIQADRVTAALELAKRFSAHVALKGCGTVVAAPDGRWFINQSGNPGLASAGSGDVLTGMLAALLAQHWPPLEALLAAVHLHGVAADACVAEGRGPVGLTATELIDAARRTLNRWIAELAC
ncbi:NAD(P)H-hydrate dehydratase [Sulfuricystis multivorans]|uniref:NAD(P)H-hydrate dehydratase n=1 Tax=Sulfuricystis multivorans TaxID=2211108 RepID=UPI0024DF75F5|nr:NAD(P)H-hydrate dehydratase [Sulfuricystis multivorans]